MARALNIPIIGDASLFSRAADQVDRDLAKIEAKADASSSSMGTSFKKASTAMLVAGGVIGAVLVDTAKKYDEQVQSDIKLENTLKNQPQLAGASSAAFKAQASALQDVTVASDESVESAQALLGQFGATQNQILTLTPLIVDYSRKLGVDLDTAAKNVGKAIDGKATALQKSGIMVDQAAYKEDRFKAVQDALAISVGGFAQQEGATFSGRMQIMKNQLGELEEGVGKGAVDAFSKLLGPVSAVSKGFQGLTPEMQSAIGSIGAVGAGALVTAGLVGKLGEKFEFMKGHMGEAVVGAAALTAGLAIVNSALEHGNQAAADMFKDQGSGFDGLVDQYNRTGEAITAEQNKLADMSTVQQLAHAQERVDLEKEKAQHEELGKQIEATRETYRRLGNDLGITGDAAKQLGDKLHIDPTTIPYDKLVAVLKDYQSGALSAEQATKLLTGSQDDQTKSVEELQKQYDEAKKSVDDFTKKILDSLTVNDKSKLSQLDLRDELAKLADQLHTNGTQWDWVHGQINENTTAGRENLRSVIEAKDNILQYGLELIKAGHSTSDATQQTLGFVDGLRQTLQQAGYTKQQVDDLLAKYGLTPAQIQTTFNTPGLQQAVTDMNDLNAQTSIALSSLGHLGDTLRNLFTQGLAASFTQGFNNIFGGGRAAGGPVQSNTLYEVAEGGAPELLNVGQRTYLMMGQQSGNVTPAAPERMSSSPSPSGGHWHFYIDGQELTNVIIRRDHAASNTAGF